MKKKYIITILGCISILILIIGFINSKQSNRNLTTKQITHVRALKEMPYIEINTEEVLFMQSLRKDTDVSLALESGKLTDLSIKKGTELARGVLPNNIKVSEFSISGDTVCFGYFINGNRVILEIFTDNSLHKTIGAYTDAGEVKAIYTNYNNESYEKSTLK